MAEMYVKKNGLLYSPDYKTVIGVDDTSDKFNGRVPFGAYYIEDEVFSECPYESASLPDSIKKIGYGLFKDSKALEKVKLPSLVTELPADLFYGCSALEKVTMPKELTGFSEGLFCGCQSLQEIPFRAGIKVLPTRVFAGCISLKSLIIPNTVESIEESAVADCTALESVVFPSSIKMIAKNAFSGCTSIHNIRIDGESNLFYVGEDGSLYKNGEAGDDELIVKVYKVTPVTVGYFEDNLQDLPVDDSEIEEEYDDEPIFTSEIDNEDDIEDYDEEIGISGEEITMKIDDDVKTDDKIEEEPEIETGDDLIEESVGIINEGVEVDDMSEDKDVDSMLADIMGEERERTTVGSDVGVSKKETEVLSQAMSVMSDSNLANKGATVSPDELEKLFSKNEEEEIAAQVSDDDELDSKTKILVNSVKTNKILNFKSDREETSDNDLFVIAEKTVTQEDGTECFSSHLESCCSKLAHIHDFKRVIMLCGLPIENDEFMEFYRHFIGMKNIMLACEADRPSKLSEYCKTVCETSRISLEKSELQEQRKYASVKTDNLIKLVVRDIYQ